MQVQSAAAEIALSRAVIAHVVLGDGAGLRRLRGEYREAIFISCALVGMASWRIAITLVRGIEKYFFILVMSRGG